MLTWSFIGTKWESVLSFVGDPHVSADHLLLICLGSGSCCQFIDVKELATLLESNHWQMPCSTQWHWLLITKGVTESMRNNNLMDYHKLQQNILYILGIILSEYHCIYTVCVTWFFSVKYVSISVRYAPKQIHLEVPALHCSVDGENWALM